MTLLCRYYEGGNHNGPKMIVRKFVLPEPVILSKRLTVNFARSNVGAEKE